MHILACVRNKVSADNVDKGIDFDQHITHVVVFAYLRSGLNFLFRADAYLGEYFLFSVQEIVKIYEPFVDMQTSLFSLFFPLFAVSITLESDLLGLLHILGNNIIY